MNDPLPVIANMIVARKNKIAGLNNHLKNHEDVVRWLTERRNHKDAIAAHLIECHRRIVTEQELGPEVTWGEWVKANCHYSERSTYRLMKLTNKPREDDAIEGPATPPDVTAILGRINQLQTQGLKEFLYALADQVKPLGIAMSFTIM